MIGEAEAISKRRGKWSQAGVPHLGWRCVQEFDAKEETGDYLVCEMCETTDVRFVHVMANERYPDQLNCGCICAGHMSGEKKQAADRDQRMRSRARRRGYFDRRKGWNVSRNGAPHIDVEGCHFVIGRKADGRFQIGAKGPRDSNHRWGPKRYASLAEAKRACFDALEFLQKEEVDKARAARAALIRSMAVI